MRVAGVWQPPRRPLYITIRPLAKISSIFNFHKEYKKLDMKNSQFRGVNSFCKTCKKSCKQFENVTVVICPNRVDIKSETTSRASTSE